MRMVWEPPGTFFIPGTLATFSFPPPTGDPAQPLPPPSPIDSPAAHYKVLGQSAPGAPAVLSTILALIGQFAKPLAIAGAVLVGGVLLWWRGRGQVAAGEQAAGQAMSAQTAQGQKAMAQATVDAPRTQEELEARLTDGKF